MAIQTPGCCDSEWQLLYKILQSLPDISGGGGGSAISVSDEGSLLTSGVTSFDFVGAGVTATAVGNAVTVTIPSGGGVASVSGTANRITSTGGANPVIDIAATYVGQTSITTLGTIATGVWNGTIIGSTFGGSGINNAGTLTWGAGGTLGTAAFTNSTAYEVPLTFSTGLTRTVNTITANLSTGVAGGQTAIGGTGASENLTLSSTSNATKGKIIFGTGGVSAYDGATGLLGLGTTSPAARLHTAGNISAAAWTTAGINIRTDSANYTDTTSSGTVSVCSVNALGVPSISATSVTTFTQAATLTVAGPPNASTNVTITTALSLRVPTGVSSFQGGVSTSTSLTSNTNFGAIGGAASGTGTTALILFAGATTVNVRSVFSGNTATTAGVGNGVANVIFGAAPITEAASGTHPLIANVVINAPAITGGAAATTDLSSFYIAGAPTGITPTNTATAMWVAGGLSKWDGQLNYNPTNTTAGTTGNVTINKASGTVNIAAAGTTVTVTNSFCAATSIVFGVVRTNDTTALLKNIVPAAGSFVITMNAAVTAETSIGWFVINQ